VTGVTLSTAFTKGTVTINSVTPYPNNSQVSAEYRIRLSTSNGIPVGGSLVLNFPSEFYGSTTTSVNCRVSEALTTFKTCTNSGNIITMVTDTALAAGSVMSISVFGVYNPDSDRAKYFTAYSTYDGTTIDQSSDTSSLNEQVAILASRASTLTVGTTTFYPKNEGEVATYIFTLTPGKDISTDSSIVITFPQTYDKRLGNSIRCSAKGVTGNLSCAVTAAYELEVKGQDKFVACTSCNIVITVHGVINPNKYTSATSGDFIIGVRKDKTYSQYKSAVGALTFVAAPAINDLLTSSVLTLDSRSDNDIYLNFTTSNTIPKSSYNGAVWVQFPSEYVLDDSSITCGSSTFWAAGHPTCSQYYERMLLSGQSNDYVGNMYVKLFNIPNPLTELKASSIIVETYDGFNYKIIDRSYANLSPTRFTYKYPGPLISIGGSKSVAIERGTMSGDIAISLERPCALNLTLTPYSSGFSFDPYEINLNVGDVYKTFRISAPLTSDVDSYIATWDISGDKVPAYYTPILKTEFSITGNKNATVTCDSISAIPKGGHSLPVFIRLGAAPDVDLKVSLEIANAVEGVSVSPSNLTFTQGETELSFVISVKNSTLYDTASLSLSLSGSSRTAYALTSSSVSFSMVIASQDAPKVSNIYFSSLTRTTAEVFITTAQISTVYYAVALAGTPVPSFEDVYGQVTPPYNNTRTSYGKINVGDSLFARFLIGNLTAETSYSVYAYAIDQLDQITMEAAESSFMTQSRYFTAYFSLKFTSFYLSEEDVDDAKAAVALILSLDDWRIGEKTLDNVYGGRRLQSSQRSTLELYIYDDPTTDNYKSPLEQVQYLATQKDKLAAMVNNLDTAWEIEGKISFMDDCEFAEAPEVSTTAARNAIAIKAQLKEKGYIYAVAVKDDEDFEIPTSRQIVDQTDERNSPVTSAWSAANGLTYANVTLANLEGATSYNVYLTCGNDYPGGPELLADPSVISVNWRIENLNTVKPLNLDSAYLLGLCLSALLVLA
jgi:histone deacetylase 6